jgi:hypothetical protein
MRKALIIVPIAGAIAIGAMAHRRSSGAGNERGERADIWARMEEKMAQMPETFPPRLMFDNIAAIREQTTRILELLDTDEGSAQSGKNPGKADA